MKNNFIKGNTLFRFGFYNIGFDNGGELNLPLRTQPATKVNEILSSVTKGVTLPTKIVPLKNDERKQLEELGFDIPKATVQQRVIDSTSNQYKEIQRKQLQYGKFLDIAQHVDLDFKFDDGKALWEILGLKSNMDYLGLCEFLVEIGVDEDMLIRIRQYISTIKVLGASNYKEALEKMSTYDAYYTKIENDATDEEKKQ